MAEKIGIIFWWKDYEEQEARRVAREAWCAFLATAIVKKEENWEVTSKVHAWNAKNAEWYKIDEWSDLWIKSVIIFENSKKAAGELKVVLNADHHNLGDSGYWKPADEYFNASSLWQLMNYLKIEPNKYQRMIAAWDHCPADAYAGKCPGIDPKEFTTFRLQQKIKFYKTEEKFHYKANAIKLKKIICNAKEILLNRLTNQDGVVDLREIWMIDELPEAALMLGKAYMTSLPELDRQRNPTWNTKVILWGHTDKKMILDFIKWWEQQPNKIDVYWDPVRWFAWVILK